MSCDVPPVRWRAGLRRPVSVSFMAAGLACMVVGIVRADGVAGLLPQVGGVLFFIGTSSGTISAHGLGSIFTVVNGTRARKADLTEECVSRQARMERLADLISVDHDSAQLAVRLTVEKAAESWTRGPGPAFALFLWCRTIAMARDLQATSTWPVTTPLDPNVWIRVIHDLREVCEVPEPQIARMLDLPIDQVRTALGRGARP